MKWIKKAIRHKKDIKEERNPYIEEERNLYEYIGDIKCFYCGSNKKLGLPTSHHKKYGRYWCLDCKKVYLRRLGTNKMLPGLARHTTTWERKYLKSKPFTDKWTCYSGGFDHYGWEIWNSNDGEWLIFRNWHAHGWGFRGQDIQYVQNLKTGKIYRSIFFLAWKPKEMENHSKLHLVRALEEISSAQDERELKHRVRSMLLSAFGIVPGFAGSEKLLENLVLNNCAGNFEDIKLATIEKVKKLYLKIYRGQKLDWSKL